MTQLMKSLSIQIMILINSRPRSKTDLTIGEQRIIPKQKLHEGDLNLPCVVFDSGIPTRDEPYCWEYNVQDGFLTSESDISEDDPNRNSNSCGVLAAKELLL